jgi:hypothetical protein
MTIDKEKFIEVNRLDIDCDKMVSVIQTTHTKKAVHFVTIMIDHDSDREMFWIQYTDGSMIKLYLENELLSNYLCYEYNSGDEVNHNQVLFVTDENEATDNSIAHADLTTSDSYTHESVELDEAEFVNWNEDSAYKWLSENNILAEQA